MSQKPLKGAALISKAKKIAIEAHKGQIDKSGEPYIGHPMRVAELLQNSEAKIRAIAYLHDVIEDTELTLDDLRREGIPEIVIQAIDAISRRKGEPYIEYIERVKKNKLAAVVKHADIMDNSSPARLEKLDPSLKKYLIKKYRQALKALLEN